jgi:peptidoglycan/LPS O-acetylase OafA/YrhL
MAIKGNPPGKVYRADIDGLRALAVLSVLIYHVDRDILPGGFVGVDIFLIISGFLITRNIWSEMLTGRFSFGSFYLKRIRRIAPAYFFMVGVTLVAGAALLLPADLLGLAKSALWGSFSASNVYFWLHLDTSYFAASSSEVPLLHTWSLGVEEQFYFIWPTLLILAAKFGHRRIKALMLVLLLCAGSFVWAELTNISAQKFAYYMLPTRAGELMIGAALAIYGTRKTGIFHDISCSRWWAEFLALNGLALVFYSLFWINDASDFPGLNAFYPSIATALLIVSGGAGSRLVKGLFTPRPVVAIGLVSYSLYLWHWPILAFFQYFYGDLDPVQICFALGAIAILSVGSYRFVERPARQWRAAGTKQFLVLYVTPLAGSVVLSVLIIATGGLRSIFNSFDGYREAVARVHEYTAQAFGFNYNCQGSRFDSRVLGEARCIIGDTPSSTTAEPAILLWGDSEAAHYIGVVGALAKEDHFRFRNATLSSCPPIFGGDYGEGIRKLSCDKFRPYMQKAILTGNYGAVVVSGAWTHYFKNKSFKRDFEATVHSLVARKIRVIIMGEVPSIDGYNRECELRAIRIGGNDCERRVVQQDDGMAPADRYLAALASSESDVYYVDVRPILCRNGYCSPYLDGRPVYFNPTHLSMDGSWFIGEKLLQAPRELERWRAAFRDVRQRSSSRSLGLLVRGNPNIKNTGFKPRPMPPILGGYVPDFPYHMRSARNIGSLRGPCAVVLEFWSATEGEIADRITASLTRLGYSLKSRTSSGDTIKMRFSGKGRQHVSVNVGPLAKLKPQSPDPSGMVYMRCDS